jgi:hypothetical protein
LQIIENKLEFTQQRDYTAFLLKAMTDCFKSSDCFDANDSIRVICLASESQDIIIQTLAQ